ncbi:MAG TPA: ammonium transporter [Thermoplasmata archaeon]|nr:ammonium transporter [Thermoplasmata archaeon]
MAGFDWTATLFLLIATALVMFMTPGLAFFYAGLVGQKNAVSIMMQSFAALGVTTLLWVSVGYSLCFSGDFHGIIGNLNQAFLLNVNSGTAAPVANGTIPLYVFFAYEMMVVIITPPLITGAFTNRVKFGSYLVFLVCWQLFVYYPMAHMVWGGGLLQQWGVLDFGGGIVVHTIAGMSALACVLYLGSRYVRDKPQNLHMVGIGMAILWFGWFGFNAGNAYAVNSVAVVAFLNTAISGGIASFVWMMMDWAIEGKPKFVGFLTGGLAGLVVITPAAGYVSPQAAMLFGAAAGIICYLAIALKNRRHWDDALDVWGVHGVGGMLGMVLLGVLASTAINPGGSNGLAFGGGSFFGKEVAAVAFAAAFAFVVTYLILFVIDRVMDVRVPKEVEVTGLDRELHGEVVYGD